MEEAYKKDFDDYKEMSYYKYYNLHGHMDILKHCNMELRVYNVLL